LILTYDEALTSCAFNFNLRRYTTATLDHPTAAALGRHITDVMGLLDHHPAAAASDVVAAAAGSGAGGGGGGYGGALVVSGGTAVYTGGVQDAGQFWSAMSGGSDPQSEVPLSRYDIDAWFDPISVRENGVVTVRHGAFLGAEWAERFDATLLRVSPAEATHLDPQQRLLLEQCARSVAAAELGAEPGGGGGGADVKARTGMYVGCMYNEAPQLQQMHGVDAGAHAGTGSGASFMVRCRAMYSKPHRRIRLNKLCV
jgi:hypothetical protein